MRDKFELFSDFKSSMELEGYLIEDVKEINYGLQFRIVNDKNSGIVRIFEGKKGTRFDFSQLKNPELLLTVQEIISPNESEIIKNNKKYVETNSSELDVFPEEMIGIDESGKGDFFGPLVTAGVYVNKKNAKILEELGVIDSKKLSDAKISDLAARIKSICPYDIVVIGNTKYNELYSKIKNLNKLLAWGHARVIENMLKKTECRFALSDQFGNEGLVKNALLDKGKTITLFQRHKAEEIISVAAASIVARDEYVSRLNQISSKYRLELPKGASTQTIYIAKQFVSQYGKQELNNVAKLHFKTMEKL
ncbi:TPA: ribonuclease HIII [Bacillus thuringiensis]|uniref:ribonuclease HIII n=1 Tax=Bacillus thuringiensis TaxID=1428 RepID=UPI0018CE2337|nr:ribonuclease HIII [Bacillus thuringiensis]MEB9532431.1 ribonuclease HIII [Bacillus cereus]MEB9725819.1 ribonuclease HIII [Bacillus cereus]